MNRLSLITGPILLSCSAICATAGSPAPSGKTQSSVSSGGYWRVTGGYMHRSLGDGNWVTGARSTLSDLQIGAGSNTPGIDDIGPADAIADRTYRDGFVFKDAGTAANGDTWYWGYQNASQVNGDIISFTGGNGTAATFTQSENYDYGGWSEKLDGGAPYMQIEWIVPVNESLSYGWQGGLSFLSTGVSNRLSPFSANKSRTDWAISYTDDYSLEGSSPPGAPYSGSLGGPGILLRNLPLTRTSSQVISGTELVGATNDIHAAFDVNLWSLSFGPVVEFHRGPFYLTASAGLTVNIANWDAEQTEKLSIRNTITGPPDPQQVSATTFSERNWRDRASGTDVLPGFFMQAALSRELNAAWSVNAFGRYDWTGSVDVGFGPSSAEASLTGWSIGAGIGYRF